jgi:hypothetical protein
MEIIKGLESKKSVNHVSNLKNHSIFIFLICSLSSLFTRITLHNFD